MKRSRVSLLFTFALGLVLCACGTDSTPAPSATPATLLVTPIPTPATSSGAKPIPAAPDGLFFSQLPVADNNVEIQIAADEQAAISAASMNANVPLDTWTDAGWQTGRELDLTEAVPDDCVLHPRQGVPHQLFAQCPGSTAITVPAKGADFVYLILFGNNRVVRKTLQTGTLYNPDTTGLIP